MKFDPDHDQTVMPSADDPSLSLEESFDRLTVAVDRITAQMAHIRETLSRFYLAPISASSLQPVLTLAEQLDPSLKAQRQFDALADEILTPADAPF